MSDPITAKLAAYLDGELDARGQMAVQTHLETCPACQKELAELRQLSNLLRAAPQPDFTSALDFKAQLMLQLPRAAADPAQAAPSRSIPNRWLLPWLAPALVLAGWILLQATLNLSTLAGLAAQAGLVDGAAAWINDAPQQMLWLTAAQATLGGLLGPQGQSSLHLLNNADLFTQNLLIGLALQAAAALLYWGSLALVWQANGKRWWFSSYAE
jgi:anti-sigma factor RsiW